MNNRLRNIQAEIAKLKAQPSSAATAAKLANLRAERKKLKVAAGWTI